MKPSFWLLTLPGVGFILLFVSILCYEWVTIGLIKDPAVLAGYPFGSEEAMGEGGWYYRDAATYAQQMLVTLVSLLPTCAVFAQAIRRRSLAWTVAAYGVFALTTVTHNCINSALSP